MQNVTFSMSRQQVIGLLKATGSRDPDVLLAAKEDMLASVKPVKVMAFVPLICGALLTLTVIGAFLGIPAFLGGLWLWFRGRKNVRTVEGAYHEYLASLNLGAQSPAA